MKSGLKNICIDVGFLLTLGIISFWLISIYHNATYINTGYADWLVHAFRVKFLLENGFISWSHVWSNGINLFQSYQFIPHVITALTSRIFALDVPRTMVLLTLIQFILLRISIYISLRLLSISHLSAFFCALLSFAFAQYWGGISDYSIIFGFTLFPFLLLLWTKLYRSNLHLIFPCLIGLLFYVHPTLGFFTGVLWLLEIFLSQKEIINKETFIKILIIIASSSFFWLPIVLRNYAYSEPRIASQGFIRQTLADYTDYGLSASIMVIFSINFLQILFPTKKNLQWVYILIAFTSVSLLAVWLSITIGLPEFITRFQFTRSTTLIGIAIIFCFAPFLDYLLKKKNIILNALLLIGLVFAISESIWFASVYINPGIKDIDDPVSAYITNHQDINWSLGSVWTPRIDISSFKSPQMIRFPYSYMGHLESNLVAPRIFPFLTQQNLQSVLTSKNVEQINDYFKISGTHYIFLDEHSTIARAFMSPTYGYKDLGRIEMSTTITHLFETPFPVISAALIDSEFTDNLTPFSKNTLTTIENQIAFDESIKKFVTMLYDRKNTILPVSYPTQETLEIVIPENRNSNLVYINESYSQGWQANVNGVPHKLFPAGPNFMQLTLDSKLTGDLVIRLKHTWPIWFYISIFLIVSSITLTGLITLYIVLQKNKIYEKR